VNITQPNPCAAATIVNPTSNLQSVIDVAGGNFCLRGGIYNEADNVFSIRSANITIRNYPGERAELRGQLKLLNSASNFRAIGTDTATDTEGLVFNPTYGNVRADSFCSTVQGGDSTVYCEVSTQGNHLYGDNALFSNVEFDGDNDVLPNTWVVQGSPVPAGTEQAPGVCNLVTDGGDKEPASDVVFEFVDAHNCGHPPRKDLTNPDSGEHAFYLSDGLRTEIRHSQIYENGTRGVQIRNNNKDARVFGNIIDQNYVGVIFDDPGATGNIVENNVITRSENGNIRALSDTGTGNVARNNCGYSPDIPNTNLNGVTLTGNVNVTALPYSPEPEPNADAVVSDSTCSAKLPAGSPFRP
jgi:hypothetical protein